MVAACARQRVTQAGAALLVVSALVARAAADPGPTADRLRADASAIVGVPFGQLGELAGPSAGVRASINYQLDDRISVGLALRWLSVPADARGFDLGYRDLAAGGRYQQPLNDSAGAFFEFEVLYGTIDIDSELNQQRESDPGTAVRGGLYYWLSPARAQMWLHTGYSRLFSDSSVPAAEWLEVGVGVSVVL